MKTNAIVRIILFSLAILILSGILIVALAIDMFAFNTDSILSGETTLPLAADEYNNVSVADPAEVNNLEIEWAAGSIQIVCDENASQITIAETNNGKEKYNMICTQSGNTLKIQFSRESVHFPSFGINVDFSKDLLITVPKDWVCVSLEIEAASANVEVTDMIIQNVSFEGASGECIFENCQFGTLDLDTASGDVKFTGTLNHLDCDAVSANLRAVLTNVPSRLEFDGVSGDLDMTLPADCGFTAAMDSLSGSFASDFPTTISEGNHIYGDGSCQIQAEGVSGNIIIRNGG